MSCKTWNCCSVTGENTGGSSSLFCHHPGCKAMPSPNRHNTYSPVVLFIGSLTGQSSVKSFVCHQQNQLWECIGRLWEPYWVHQGLMNRQWERQEPRGSVDGEADRLVAARTLRPARCCMLSSLFLTSKNQHPRRDWLAKVSVHDHSLAVQGQGRKEMAPFASLERSIWICVPTKTSHN